MFESKSKNGQFLSLAENTNDSLGKKAEAFGHRDGLILIFWESLLIHEE